ncbi:MAG: CapA family protein [Bacteroidetes bacterium]|nr:CapA family protein [Bacteroidota bacterium]
MKYINILLVLLNFAFIAQAQDSSKIVSVIAVGDIMLGTDFPRDRLPASDGNYLLKEVNEILRSSDITFGNYEGVLLDGGKPRKICKDTTKCYLFRTPTRYVDNLQEAGFDLVSIANNHSNDFGESGIQSTIRSFEKVGIKYSGPIGKTSVYSVNGLSVGFIAFATSPGMYSILNISSAIEAVKKLKNENDIVIVSFHGGAEGVEALHVKNEKEIAYGEDRGNVVDFSHSVIDAGADLVIGHGPHVPRALELYNTKLIAYSLGNFCTYEGFSLDGPKGLAPILRVNLNSEGDFVNGSITSAKQTRPYGPLIDKDNQAAKLIRKLTLDDFPTTKLLINTDGGITPNK